MVELIVGLIVVGLSGILQSAILSRLVLINGQADVILLLIIGWTIQPFVRYPWIWVLIAGFVTVLTSSTPIGVIPVAYAFIFLVALFLRQRFWKARLLTMIGLSMIGTILVHIFLFIALIFQGNFLSVVDAFYLITLPSILLNLMLSVPVYAITRELVRWIYPEKIEV